MDDFRNGKVLLDVPAGGGAFDRSLLERFGHPVHVCGGPEPGERCPLLGREGCEPFRQAHGIIFELDLDEPQHVAILLRYHELAPDVPIRVVCRPDQAETYRELLAPFETWTHYLTAADLDGFAAEVEAADRFI